MPRRNHDKYKKGSHNPGDLVEFIGNDKKNRGVGIVLEEIEFFSKDNIDEYTHIKIFWNLLCTEEIVHKRFVRRLVSIETGIVILQNSKK